MTLNLLYDYSTDYKYTTVGWGYANLRISHDPSDAAVSTVQTSAPFRLERPSAKN